jgi:hypothetical protein
MAFPELFQTSSAFPRTTIDTRQHHKMPPIRTAKKSDKRTARPQKQRAGGRTKSQAALGRTEDATTEKPYMEEDISPELAELLGGAT